MNLRGIFSLFTLSVIVKGAWLAATVQPVLLSIGTVFTALNIEPIEWKNFLPFINKQEKEKTTEKAIEKSEE